MLRLIEAIRKKPKPVRNIVAFWTAAMITLLIVGVWSMSLPSRVADIMNIAASTEPASAPPSQFMANVRASMSNFLGQEDEPATTLPPAAASGTALYEIDLSAMKEVAPTATTTNNQRASTTGVWQREYRETTGRPVLIATTTKATTTASSTNDVLQ